MADSGSNAAASSTAGAKPAAAAAAATTPPKPQNPAMRMMGMPNFRFKLPSRNWLIFLSITGSWFAAVIYDRREKRKIQQKWSNLVAHIAKEPLPSNELRRKLTVVLSAPPGDGLRSAREYFKEYVKPILVAGALDYEVIEGRKEGDVRSALAERIRQKRREAGEKGAQATSSEGGAGAAAAAAAAETEAANLMDQVRANFNIHPEPGPKGDLVLGRNTWREYIRGIHEGWLGPLDPPPMTTAIDGTLSEGAVSEVVPTQGSAVPDEQTTSTEIAAAAAAAAATTTTTTTTEPLSETTPESADKPTETTTDKNQPTDDSSNSNSNSNTQKNLPTPSYLLPSSYAHQPTPPSLPETFEPSSPIYFPHILGFLNTPIRMYRFLNKRKVADSVGEEVAALVLGAKVREYRHGTAAAASTAMQSSEFTADASPISSESGAGAGSGSVLESTPTPTPQEEWEQASLLAVEEADWHKSARKERADALEREWLDPVVIDGRIGARMRRFVVPEEERERAERIFRGEEWVLGEVKPAEEPVWKRVMEWMGFGEDGHPSRKVVVGNYEGEFDD